MARSQARPNQRTKVDIDDSFSKASEGQRVPSCRVGRARAEPGGSTTGLVSVEQVTGLSCGTATCWTLRLSVSPSVCLFTPTHTPTQPHARTQTH